MPFQSAVGNFVLTLNSIENEVLGGFQLWISSRSTLLGETVEDSQRKMVAKHSDPVD